MKRREFIAGLSAVVSTPRFVQAQDAAMRRLGILIGGRGADDPEGQARIDAIRGGLAQHGWREGRNIRVDLRWAAGDLNRIKAAATEITALKPDVILANATPAIGALLEQTKTIPIVFAQIVDPVGLGYVQSLARPGGNVTGFTFVDLDFMRKWPEVLHELAPGVTRAALLFNPATTPFYDDFIRRLDTSRQPGAVSIFAATVVHLDDLDSVISDLARVPGTGVIIPPNPLMGANRGRIAELCLRHLLPSIAVYREYAPQGGLMSYGPNSLDIFRRSTDYVDRILKGANAGDLPVQAPVTYELAVNLKTARALGLTVPSSLLARADEVIE